MTLWEVLVLPLPLLKLDSKNMRAAYLLFRYTLPKGLNLMLC